MTQPNRANTETLPSTIRNAALLSEDGAYRYWLSRGWGVSTSRYVNFVCLNPSTADARLDDPTVRRLTSFAEAWQYDGFYLTNLYALRSTDPKALRGHPAPIGQRNNDWIEAVARGAALVVCAWGAHGGRGMRGEFVIQRLTSLMMPLFCFGRTKAGDPMHPLYLAGNTQLERLR